MFNETLTLFNRVGNRKDGDTWYAKVLTGTCFYTDRSALVSMMGEQTGDRVIIHIPLKGGKANGYTYLKPVAWKRAQEYGTTFTLTGGNDFDFVLRGAWSGESVIMDNDYTAGFYDYIRKHYDDVFAVSNVSDHSKGFIPHLEVTGQ